MLFGLLPSSICSCQRVSDTYSEDNELNVFLELGDRKGACSVHSTHRSGIAVLSRMYTPLPVL